LLFIGYQDFQDRNANPPAAVFIKMQKFWRNDNQVVDVGRIASGGFAIDYSVGNSLSLPK